MNGSGPGQGGGSPREPGRSADEITCREFVELITDYFEGKLTPRSLRLVEEHLVICDWCVTYTEQMRATVDSLGALRDEEPVDQPEPSAAVLAALEARRGGQVIAYKFLDSGRVGPFSRFQWPRPGVWVRAVDGVAACRAGIHACRTQDLPWWLGRELWEVELEGEIAIDEHKLVAKAGRLRTRVDGWTLECADEYGVACAWRARDRAAQALRRAEHERDAARLEACATLEEVRALARELAAHVPDARISLAMARDGGRRALTSAPATSAYIAAHAARRLDGEAAYTAERRWQSAWLVNRLALPAG